MADSHHEPPGLPQIRDEAANTPMWVPALGLGLLVLFVLMIALQAATRETEMVHIVVGADDQAVEVTPGDTPEAAPAPAEPAPGH